MNERHRRLAAIYGQKAIEFTKAETAKQGKGQKDQIFPTIRPGSQEWSRWEAYFNGYLGFEPTAMTRTRNEIQQWMTVPTQWPEWFDPGYTADKGGYWSPAKSPRTQDRRTNFANLYIGSDAPQYRAMLQRAQDPMTDKREFRYDEERGGLWVSQKWIWG